MALSRSQLGVAPLSDLENTPAQSRTSPSLLPCFGAVAHGVVAHASRREADISHGKAPATTWPSITPNPTTVSAPLAAWAPLRLLEYEEKRVEMLQALATESMHRAAAHRCDPAHVWVPHVVAPAAAGAVPLVASTRSPRQAAEAAPPAVALAAAAPVAAAPVAAAPVAAAPAVAAAAAPASLLPSFATATVTALAIGAVSDAATAAMTAVAMATEVVASAAAESAGVTDAADVVDAADAPPSSEEPRATAVEVSSAAAAEDVTLGYAKSQGCGSIPTDPRRPTDRRTDGPADGSLSSSTAPAARPPSPAVGGMEQEMAAANPWHRFEGAAPSFAAPPPPVPGLPPAVPPLPHSATLPAAQSSRPGSVYPSPGATPPRAQSPPPTLVAVAPLPLPDALLSDGLDSFRAAAAATRGDGAPSAAATVRAAIQQQLEHARAMAVRASADDTAAASPPPSGSHDAANGAAHAEARGAAHAEAHAEVHAEAHAGTKDDAASDAERRCALGGSDAVTSVSWQSVAYGPHAETVLPRPQWPQRPRQLQSQQSQLVGQQGRAAGLSTTPSALSEPCATDTTDASPVSAAAATATTAAEPTASATAAMAVIGPMGEPPVHSSSLLKPRPRPLELSTSHARGAVGQGGAAAAAHYTAQTTSYRSLGRARQVAALAVEGQARLLPPDRPNQIWRLRERPKARDVMPPPPRPFVARTARARFAHDDAWLD